MKRFRAIGLVFLCFFTILAGGCGIRTTETEAIGYTVVDSRGKALQMKKSQRIICTYVFADEILLDLVDHSRIVGMDKWIHDPNLSMAVESAKDITNEVGDSAEYMISLRPDLVILGERSVRLASVLEGSGVPVFTYKEPKNLEEIPETIYALGMAVGEKERADALVQKMMEELTNIEKRVGTISEENRKRGILVLRFGAIGGKGNIFHDVLTKAGVVDVYNEVRRSQELSPNGTSMILSKEEFVRTNPDIIIMGNWFQGGAYKDSYAQMKELLENPAYSSMKAVQEKSIIVIPQRNVNCLSHHVTEGIETVYDAVYGKGK